MSTVVLEDFFKTFRKGEVPEKMAAIVMRATVLILGVLSVGLVYVVEHLGTILQLTLSIPTCCFGPLFGIYMIGFFLPWINKKATFYSGIVSFLTILSFVFKVQTEIALGHIRFPTKSVSVDGCLYNFTQASSFHVDHSVDRNIYYISYLYYTLIGAAIVMVLATVLSFVMGFEDVTKIEKGLLAPFLRKYIMTEEIQMKNGIKKAIK
jgi:solute carrier family 5 (sodium-coupled monocarboxylate transporter), member 8/12